MGRLKELIKKGTIAVPGAFNAASALLVEKAGLEDPTILVAEPPMDDVQALPDALLTRRALAHEVHAEADARLGGHANTVTVPLPSPPT